MIEPALIAQLHLGVGTLAVLGGFAAFLSPKGGPIHRLSGQAFFYCMLLLCLSGLWMSLSRSILFTVFLAALAAYAVTSGWAAAGTPTRSRRVLTVYSGLCSGLITAGCLLGALAAANSPDGQINDLPPAAFLVLAAVSTPMMVFDLSYARTDRPSRARQLARHAGRMGLGLLIATFIFFFGNSHVLPDAVQHPALMAAPVLAVAALLLGNLVRLRRPRSRPS
ncbi:DUF2306 domain-containing protein [Maricaulis sp. CAU 1757]